MSSHAQDKAVDLAFSLLMLGAVVGAVWWLGNKAVEKVSATATSAVSAVSNTVNKTVAAAPVVAHTAMTDNLFIRINSVSLDLWDDGTLNNSANVVDSVYDWVHGGSPTL